MKMMTFHCDYFKYTAKRRMKLAEPIEDPEKSGNLENVLLVKMAIEKADEAQVQEIAEKATEYIKNIFEKIKPGRILLYPCIQLLFGAEPAAGPDKSLELMKLIYSRLKERSYPVTRAPFGWDKIFEMKCKAHPLAELGQIIH